MKTDEYNVRQVVDKLNLTLSEEDVDNLVTALSEHLDATLTIHLKNKEEMEKSVALKWLVWLQSLQIRVETNQETHKEGLERLVDATWKFIDGNVEEDS